MLKVYLGYDSREETAYRVAQNSILRRTEKNALTITPLRLDSLEASGLLRRPREYRDGKLWDRLSEAYMSTEFAISRFLTPILAQTGWALFMDSDIVALTDIRKILLHADPSYAVMCVKHPQLNEVGRKMDNQVQSPYLRKNWSSVMLFNCDHQANRGLTITGINTVPGRDLHRFFWLDDKEIGALPKEWNWLVGVEEEPAFAKIAHFTRGGPWFDDWSGGPHDEVWLQEHRNLVGATGEKDTSDRHTKSGPVQHVRKG